MRAKQSYQPKGRVGSKLTPKEKAIVDALCENGDTEGVLMTRFNIARVTLHSHMKQIFNKTGYSSRSELIANTLHKRYQAERDIWI